MMAPSSIRIVFALDPTAWHGTSTERLWADPVGDRRFRIRNTPFFAFGVSYEDIIFAEDHEEELHFAGISIRGGHSTYRLWLIGRDRNLPSFQKYWEPLEKLGCSYEEGPVLAVDVPPNADIYIVYRLLESGTTAGVWDFEEGHCGHLLDKISEQATEDSR
jgi:hypothetical protein